jgi:hypothetical protein
MDVSTDATSPLYLLLTPSLIRVIKMVEISKLDAPNPCISYAYGLLEAAEPWMQSSLSVDFLDNNFGSVFVIPEVPFLGFVFLEARGQRYTYFTDAAFRNIVDSVPSTDNADILCE